MPKSESLTIKQEKFCPDCGRNLALVGRMHRCVPVVNNTQHEPVEANVINAGAERQSKWRKANPELNRQRAREGMRKLRAANGCA